MKCGLLLACCILTLNISVTLGYDIINWCTVGILEFKKCSDWSEWLQEQARRKADWTQGLPILKCIDANDKFECFQLVKQDKVQLVVADSGLSYYAGKFYDMIPIALEQYRTEHGANKDDYGKSYYSVAVIKKKDADEFKDLKSLKDKPSCYAGIGQAASWVLPFAQFIEKEIMPITRCNGIVKSAQAFYGDMCVPDALSSDFNRFGDNPSEACALCSGTGNRRCTSGDPMAGHDGAIRCLLNGGKVAWVRDSSPYQFVKSNTTGKPLSPDDFMLLCPTGEKVDISQYKTCNWGLAKSDVVMANALNTDDDIKSLHNFLEKATANHTATVVRDFSPFKSKHYGRENLLFSDETVKIVPLASSDQDFRKYLDFEYMKKLNSLKTCPWRPVRWCVISEPEMSKCAQMKSAFKGRGLQPDLDCVLADGSMDCAQLISVGDADVVAVDPGDAYFAGRDFDLVPIVAEDYGDNSHSYKVVAVVRKKDKDATLFNLKNRRSCHSAAGTAAGWYIPLASMIQSGMVRIRKCNAAFSLGEFFLRSCVPGILDKRFNPYDTNPIDLCESCASGGHDKCRRDSRELYYGTTGAFRCLVENGGDIAYVRHTTVLINTDGRNEAYWARNRRSEDYQLLCKNGHRRSINQWQNCYLDTVPSNVIMTAGFKSDREREIYWNLINYAQVFFGSDMTSDFNMFHSGFTHNDLIFNDATMRLINIPRDLQNYRSWLGKGTNFLNVVKNVEEYDCYTGSWGAPPVSPLRSVLIFSVFAVFAL